ncbi:hypothetical protein NDU88_007171 [Pleurodeles waltl]|uniref:Uncharacterized protein n=1 Tax=Pleurodeles waltl TaxID=8319 RepID=A0AAV7WGX0_PLEWA|nr:hypothetical protein NDU88_007171 [Pleurodeles waltl]
MGAQTLGGGFMANEPAGLLMGVSRAGVRSLTVNTSSLDTDQGTWRGFRGQRAPETGGRETRAARECGTRPEPSRERPPPHWASASLPSRGIHALLAHSFLALTEQPLPSRVLATELWVSLGNVTVLMDGYRIAPTRTACVKQLHRVVLATGGRQTAGGSVLWVCSR